MACSWDLCGVGETLRVMNERVCLRACGDNIVETTSDCPENEWSERSVNGGDLRYGESDVGCGIMLRRAGQAQASSEAPRDQIRVSWAG